MSMSLMEKLKQARAKLAQQDSDPWKALLKRCLPDNVTSISSVALLDLLNFPATTGSLLAQGFGNIVQFELFRSESEFTTIVALIVAVELRAVQSRLGV
jgi:ABC-type methionine transport system permease subunit